MRKWYAIEHTEWSLNDSAEKIREWCTAEVLAFTSKRKRDAFCSGDPFRIPLTRQQTRKYVYDVHAIYTVK